MGSGQADSGQAQDADQKDPTSAEGQGQGTLEAIWIKRVRRGPMDPVPTAFAQADKGLKGNADLRRRRQVTLLSANAWEDVERDMGKSIDPRSRRANLFVRGLDLRHSRDRILAVGECRLRIGGETRPCRLMDDAVPGLQQALDPDWRAGVFGQVLNDAEIHVGDPVYWVTGKDD